MEDVRLHQHTLFDDPNLLEWDLETAAQRARLLAWTYEKVCTAEFSPTADNAFAWQIGEMFFGMIASTLDKAAAVGELHHRNRSVEASARTSAAWENYFRDHLSRAGRPASEIETELAKARAALPAAALTI